MVYHYLCYCLARKFKRSEAIGHEYNHDHGTSKASKADFWTKFSSFGEMTASFLSDAVETLVAIEQETSLTLLQRAALVGDFISHAGDIAGPITFVVDLASQYLPKYGKIISQCGATLFGMMSSVANVRTCQNSMLEINEKAAKEE